jgi:ABC-type multidrug transport system ATPase subunit
VLSCSDLQFSYGSKQRLNGVSFAAHAGEVVGFFGHNGSGKSTLLNMLSAVLPINHGSVHFLGCDAVGKDKFLKRELRRFFGVLFQGTSSDDKLCSVQNLNYYGRLMGIPQSEITSKVFAILMQAQLEHRADEPVKKLSGGMRRRLELYRTFLHQPKMLILDEPCAGLDAQESARFLLYLKQYQLQTNAAVIMASHDPAEILACDRVIMMSDGSVIADGTPKDMLKQLNYVRCTITVKDGDPVDVGNMPWFDVDRDQCVLKAKINSHAVADFLRHPFLLSPAVKGFAIENPSLADVYEGLRHKGQE